MPRFNISLSGYNALTDTNPDHFSLYSDEDNVLIKEYLRSTDSIANLGSKVINHNFGYVPFFAGFAPLYGYSTTEYQPIDHNFITATYGAYSTQNTLTLSNYSGTTTTISSLVFYDEITPGTPSFSESEAIMKVARSGYNALTDTNPNHYIVHSDLNTFSIIKEGVTTISVPSGGGYVSLDHGAGISVPHAFFAFIQFPDGSVTRVSSLANTSYDDNYSVSDCYITSDKIYLYVLGSGSFNVKVKYYITEIPLFGSSGKSISLSDHKARVAKRGYDALTDTDSNHYNFLSGFNTLKYYDDGVESLSINGTGSLLVATGSVYHGLGYYPFFVSFTNDPAVNAYNTIPYNNSSFLTDNFASTWCDSSYLYFKFIYSGSSNITHNFYYKIFRNNLGF